jgi:hypothetical protein
MRGHNMSNGPTGPYEINPLTGQPLNWIPEIYRDGLWSGTTGQ